MKVWPCFAVIAILMVITFSPVDAGETKLLFSAQGATIPAGKSINLGKVEVGAYSAIRVVVSTRLDSDATAAIQLILMEGDEQYLAALDTIVVAPQSTATRVYQVPGRKLLIQAAIAGSSGSAGIDLIMYGTP